MFKNIKVKTLLIASGILIVILASINLLINYQKLTSIESHLYEKDHEVAPQIANFLELKIDVIQVQQWLTDISATRAKEGYDDGFTEAKSYFEKANKVLEILIADHIKFEDHNMVRDIEAFKKDFSAYYEVGKKMANAYIHEGTDAGNKMMEKLDPFAEKLTQRLSTWIKEHTEENIAAGNSIESEIKVVEHTSLIISMLFIIITIVVFSILYNKVIKALGNFEAGLIGFFKYLNKETQNVTHLDASSFDEFGLMAKVVNTNIDNTKKHIEEDNLFIENVNDVVEEVNKGSFNQTININTSNESLNELKTLLNTMFQTLSENISKDLNKIEEALEKYKNFDFTYRMPDISGKTEVGLNALAEIINEMLIENKRGGIMLNDSSQKLLSNISTLNVASNEAASSIEETAAALEQITGNISNNTENVAKMASFANEVTTSANEGGKLAKQTTLSMDEINEQVSSINEAITVIDQIAFQTNILSLNAAVEAATAGEAGKGFAVVAQEVRNLASRSAEAAKEIKDLVENATTKANEGKSIADKMILGYNGLNESISKTIELIKSVEFASKEQHSGIVQINDAVNTLDQQTQQNVNVANEAQSVANITTAIAEKIIDYTDSKEFIGKHEVDRRKKPLDPNYNGTEKRDVETRIKKINKDVSAKVYKKIEEDMHEHKMHKVEKEKIVPKNIKDDEWESF